MAITVRIVKADVAKLRAGIVPPGLIDRIDNAELLAATKKNAPKGILMPVAIEAFRQVLGSRLVLPPNGAHGVWSAIGARLRALGLTREDCLAVATAAGAEWRGAIKAESLVRQADVLLEGKSTAFKEPEGFRGALAPEDE